MKKPMALPIVRDVYGEHTVRNFANFDICFVYFVVFSPLGYMSAVLDCGREITSFANDFRVLDRNSMGILPHSWRLIELRLSHLVRPVTVEDDLQAFRKF